MNWLCRFGIHAWGPWSKARESLLFIWQDRTCTKCGKYIEKARHHG